MVQLLLQVLHSHVLTFKVDKSMLGDTEFDNLLFLWYDEENGNKTTDHYVIVTGIYRDDVANQLFLRVSSWGHEFYIDYHNYVNYVGSYSNDLISNTLYIR